MMISVQITTKKTISIDLKSAAEWFANLGDERQADFFVEVAEVSKKWECQGQWTEQYWLVGRHLRTCACSTDDARDLVRELAAGLAGPHSSGKQT
jgi:hypothetical protein